MAHTITGKLNKAATQFQAGESTGFGLRLGVKFYDRETKKDEYTNYELVVFAKAPAQVQFYQNVLVEGAVVEVSGDKQKIRQFQGQNGLSLSIELLDAKLGFVHAPNQQPQQQPQPQRQVQGYQQDPQGYPVQQKQPMSQQQPQQYDNYGRPIQQMPQQRPQQRSQLEQQLPEFHDDIPF